MSKNLVWVIVGVLVLALAIAGYLYWRSTQKPSGAVGAVEKVSEAVPEITTNPADKIPEVNPLDRANPFKYTNPLR